MSIDRLSSTSGLFAALRAELTRARDRAGGKASVPLDRTDAERTTSRDPAALRKQLSEIVTNIAIDDVDGMRAARARVVRAVLLWEFGVELREYSEWQPMLDTLLNTLENDARHGESFRQLVHELQTSG